MLRTSSERNQVSVSTTSCCVYPGIFTFLCLRISKSDKQFGCRRRCPKVCSLVFLNICFSSRAPALSVAWLEDKSRRATQMTGTVSGRSCRGLASLLRSPQVPGLTFSTGRILPSCSTLSSDWCSCSHCLVPSCKRPA